MKTILITGGASGIGAATARHLARTHRVVIADINADMARQTALDIAASGHEAHAIAVDVAKRSSVDKMADEVAARFGPVHGLFNNAGAFTPQDTLSIAYDGWEAALAVHVKSVFFCCQAVLPGMIAAGGGAVVNMSSDYAVRGMMRGALYASAKSAVFSLTKSLALEFASQNIRFNAVGPGPIETPLLRGTMNETEWNSFRAERAKLVPMGRLGLPEEVATVVGFLLSERSSYMTGQIVHPNGGQLSW